MEPIRKTSTKYISTILLFTTLLIGGCSNEDTTSNGPGGLPPITPTTSCPAGTICLGTGNGGNPGHLLTSILVHTLNTIKECVSVSATGNIELTDGRVIAPAGVTPIPPNANQTYPYGAPAGTTMAYFAQNGSAVSGPFVIGDGAFICRGNQGSAQLPLEVRAYINVLNPAAIAIKSGFRSLTLNGGTTGVPILQLYDKETVVLEPNNDQPWIGSVARSISGSYNEGDKLIISNTTFNPLQNVSTPHAQHAPAPLSVGSSTLGLISYLGILAGPSAPYYLSYQRVNGRRWGTLAISGTGNNLDYYPINYDPAKQEWNYTIPSGFFGVGRHSGALYFAETILAEWQLNRVTLGGTAINVKKQ